MGAEVSHSVALGRQDGPAHGGPDEGSPGPGASERKVPGLQEGNEELCRRLRNARPLREDSRRGGGDPSPVPLDGGLLLCLPSFTTAASVTLALASSFPHQFAGATTILLQELFYLFLPAAWSSLTVAAGESPLTTTF